MLPMECTISIDSTEKVMCIIYQMFIFNIQTSVLNVKIFNTHMTIGRECFLTVYFYTIYVNILAGINLVNKLQSVHMLSVNFSE